MNAAIGRRRNSSDQMGPSAAAMLHAVLGGDGPAPVDGSVLPAMWQHVYFRQAVPAGNTGEDGHERPGGFIPDFGLTQRMWAGGKLSLHEPRLRLGIVADRETAIEDISEKAGRSGRLMVVRLRHRYRQDGKLVMTEFQDLVYRHPGRLAASRPAGRRPEQSRPVSFDEVLLFRYSALTFNSHRIHYDADYCRQVAGYPGLVVHGPLLATLLAMEAERILGCLQHFAYRAVAPVHCGDDVSLCWRRDQGKAELWIEGRQGGLRMTATAS